MNNEIEAEKVEIIEQTIQAIRMIYHKGIPADFEIKPEFWDILNDYISSLKSQLEQYEWQSGHPDSDRLVLVCYGFDDGVKKYETDYFEKDGWYYGWGYNPLAWSEIRPYGGE